MKLITQGAEAHLYDLGSEIKKVREGKSYRIEELDRGLRRSRTKREAKVLDKLAALDFPSPRLVSCDDERILVMEKLKGELVKDILDKRNSGQLCKAMEKNIAMMHNAHIIHGDLTTSNMIFNDEVFFIDFGLSFFSHKIEDMAVDLHVLQEALDAKHHVISETCFDLVLKSYTSHCTYGKDVLQRLENVQNRGRYRTRKTKRKTTKQK